MTDDELDLAVWYVLRLCVGKGRAMPRWAMVERIFGSPVPLHLQHDDHPQDRLIRASVSRLRAQGRLICDLGDGQGRYLAASAEEFWEMYAAYVKPIKTRAEVARAMKKSAAVMFPNLLQPSLFTAIESVDDLEVV